MDITPSRQFPVLEKTFNGARIRFGGASDNPWFVAMDVSTALGIQWKYGDTLSSLDDDQRGYALIPDASGNYKPTLVLYESGLYEMIFRSRKPEARSFRRWVTGEVLPSIRKTGSYSTDKRRQRYFTTGKDGNWIEARVEGVQSRHGLTDALKEHGVTGMGYGQVTNATYKGLFNANAPGLREQMGLPPKANLRDHLPLKALVQVSFSELLTEEVLQARNLQGNRQAADAAYETAIAVKDIGKRLTKS